MWINLDPAESIVNLDLNYFNDCENPEWEYLFWTSLEDPEDPREQLVEQSLLYSDSVANANESAKRANSKPAKNQVLRNFGKKDTQKSEFSNYGDAGKENQEKSISRNLTIIGRNVGKNSSQNYLSSQSIKEETHSPQEPRKMGGISQSSLNGAHEMRKKTFVGKSKNIARVLHENQKRDMQRVSRKVDEFVFLMENPHSWVSKLEIDYKDYVRGSLMGKITRFYRKTEVDIYAEYSQPDGLVKKVNMYEDFKKTMIREVRYFYRHRKDNLFFRRKFPFRFLSVDYYNKNYKISNQLNGYNNKEWPHWRQIHIEQGRSRVVKYYPLRFHDGLIERHEIIGQKTIERYENREDGLVYCSVRFREKSMVDDAQNKEPYTYHDNHIGPVVVLKMVQKFEKRGKRHANEEVRKIIVDLVRNRVRVEYHLDSMQIAPVVREFEREKIISVTGGNDIEEEEHMERVMREVYLLEKNCYHGIKQSETRVKEEFEKFRQETEQKINVLKEGGEGVSLQDILEKRVFDTDAKQPKEKEEGDSDKEDCEVTEEDLIGPVIDKRGLKGVQLTDNMIQDIKNDILEDLRKRNKERIDILRDRFEKEKLKINGLVKKVEREDGLEERDEIGKLTFKLSILEQRMTNLHKKSMIRFQELEKKLDEDLKLRAKR